MRKGGRKIGRVKATGREKVRQTGRDPESLIGRGTQTEALAGRAVTLHC